MKYKLVYNPEYNVLGILVNDMLIKVQEDAKVYMPYTDKWEVVGWL